MSLKICKGDVSSAGFVRQAIGWMTMMSNLPEHWLTNAAVVDTVLANGRVGRLLLEVLVEMVQFSRHVLSHLCEGHQAEGARPKSRLGC